ncbi:MAG: hypothetical protein HC906_00795 [Bacteroidales bacterium]|nr:hypothetical protein [Bacteroidales bacterium]
MEKENGPASWTPIGQTNEQRKAMAAYIKNLDPYKNFVAIHTLPSEPDIENLVSPLLGHEPLDGLSLQLHDVEMVHSYTKNWLERSEKAGKTWVVCSDEIGPYWKGVMPDSFDPAHDTIRKEVLWGNLMAGGGGVEWYFGYRYPHADLNCEDWRTRENMWKQTSIALKFFQEHLPFTEMETSDHLIAANGNYCFSKAGEIYAVYLKNGGSENLNLSGVNGTFDVSWFNPRTGGKLLKTNIKEVNGGKMVQTGLPPDTEKQDWVILLRKIKS